MIRWIEQTYKYHFGNIPLNEIAVDWTDALSTYSCVIELPIFQPKSLPTLQEFINKL